MLHAYRRNGFVVAYGLLITVGIIWAFSLYLDMFKKVSIDECMELKYFFFLFSFWEILFLSGFMFETNRKAFLKEPKAN